MKLSKSDVFKTDQSFAWLSQILRDIKTRNLTKKQVETMKTLETAVQNLEVFKLIIK